MCNPISDDDADRPSENGPPPPVGPRGPKNRPLLGVRGRSASATGGNFRADRALARVHLVRYSERRARPPGAQDRLAGRPG